MPLYNVLFDSWIWLVYVAFLGASAGSFTNVLVARLPVGLSVVWPRSRCPKCTQEIAWYDNIPIISYCVLRAACRHCKSPIGPRYVLVELLMAALWLALWFRFGASWEFVMWAILCIPLLAIVFLDIDHWWIPDVLIFPFALFAAGFIFLRPNFTFMDALGGLMPAALLFTVGFVFEKVWKKEGLGLGDVKLLALIGIACGLTNTLLVLVLASLQGALVGTAILFSGGHRTEPKLMKLRPEEEDAETNGLEEDDWVPDPKAVPFGPFIILGAWEVVLFPISSWMGAYLP